MSKRIIIDIRYLVVKHTIRKGLNSKMYWNGRRWVKDIAKAMDFESGKDAGNKAALYDRTCRAMSFVQFEKMCREYPYNGPWPPIGEEPT